MNIQELIDKGYKRVSNRYRIIARVDITDEELLQLINKQRHHVCHIKKIDENWRDWYRRCLSQDTMIVPLNIYKQIPPSR